MKIEDKVEQTIDSICDQLQKANCFNCGDSDVFIGITNALAALVTAKAELNMSIRMHDSGRFIRDDLNS